MFNLVKAAEHSYYINSPSKIGIYRANEKDVYLIDSGNDKGAGKRVLRVLDEQGWSLKGIINTHAHADHIGGNSYLQDKTGCKIFANGVEAKLANHTLLGPSLIYGGYPCQDLKHKFLFAQESNAVDVSDPDFPGKLQIIPLLGHTFDMIGIRTPDNVVYLADCVNSEKTLEKYKITFIYDVQRFLDTLDKVERIQADLFVPSHADATSDISYLTNINRENVYEIEDKILQFLSTPMSFESLLKRLFDEYHLRMNFEQYALVGCTVRSYLAWLKDNKKINVRFDDNTMLWYKE